MLSRLYTFLLAMTSRVVVSVDLDRKSIQQSWGESRSMKFAQQSPLLFFFKPCLP